MSAAMTMAEVRSGDGFRDADKAFAASLLALRLERGMTQRQLALKAGVASSTVCILEKGATGVLLRVAAALAKALGTTLDEMTGGGSG